MDKWKVDAVNDSTVFYLDLNFHAKNAVAVIPLPPYSPDLDSTDLFFLQKWALW